MKVTLPCKIFKNAMNYNKFTIEGCSIDIHNSDSVKEVGIGFIQHLKNDYAVTDMVSFTLNKKDYNLLGALKESNIEIEKKGNVIIATQKGFKARFADMKDTIVKPYLDDLVDTGITYKDIYNSRLFIGKPDEGRIQYDGVTLYEDRIVASDSYCIYYKTLNNNGPDINIPKDVFKYLHPSVDYKIKTNGKVAVFEYDGDSMLYTNLISILGSSFKFDDSCIVEFTAQRAELLEKLKIIKEYSNQCNLTAENDVLILTTPTTENELSLSLPIKSKNLVKLNFGINTRQLIKMASVSDTEEVDLKFDKRMMKVLYPEENTITAATRVSIHDMPFEVTGG